MVITLFKHDISLFSTFLFDVLVLVIFHLNLFSYNIFVKRILSVVISGDGWFYDFGDSNRAFKRDCTVYTGY